MRPPLIDIIAGARPNFMKIAPIIRALDARRAEGSTLGYRLVHTGQHFDARMSGDFFEQLWDPHAPSDLSLVVGDVTSIMACAITAQNMRVLVAHVEAGIRSDDWTMPADINGMVTASVSNHFFTTSETANQNLFRSGGRHGDPRQGDRADSAG
jgi:UDP-N-acetylglucosamine 2-epimerase (non-hydrolysing)